ncbi:DNA-3-methyladenine glycosylase I [Pleionea mediterranea]|uniref:DNA-3-methyladenine glycosylase I n=1 Tax=Pleionea mediterranea TaxID=523701 RepID=A0A316FF76_9GAMM|nr:DNA-3-methyladenine glycosylase I [Pleionea mediterranea]PWK46326.1 DNA-3-methyladenine glycosylase I [Pleionea mediterranea]
MPTAKNTIKEINRCGWCSNDPLYQDYHDNEWGVPIKDDQQLFEMLCLEGAQAGLSWITVLKKRERYRQVFHGFDIEKMAAMSDQELERLLKDPGIIRNKLKVFGFRKNAHAYLEHFSEQQSFVDFIWSFVDHQPLINQPKTLSEVPATTEISDKMSKALKKKGFTFVGSTICYAFMQAAGLVDDHTRDCFRFNK